MCSRPKIYHVRSEWFNKEDSLHHVINTWCKQINQHEVFCQICNQSISCSTKGIAAINQHVETKKHTDNAKVKLEPCQLHLALRPPVNGSGSGITSKCTSQSITMISSRDAATRAEIIWCLKNISSNMSANSCDDLAQVFEAMFPNCVPNGFSIGRTKMTYILTEALGPYFRNELIADAHKSWYTIIYDETTNNEGRKELQVAIRYWSETEQEVVVKHLETFFIGTAKAENIQQELVKAIDNANLATDKLLMLGSDGPNVNKAVWRLLNEELKASRSVGLIDIGTCNIHTIHNAFLKGIKELGDDVNDLIINVFYFFDGWPTRCEDYQKKQVEKGLKIHSFIKHVSSRWLTMEKAAERLIEQWPALKCYFLDFIPKKRSHLMNTAKYKLIATSLKQNDIEAQLYFVVSSAQVFTSFTRLFQKEEPLIHVLYDSLYQLLFTVIGKVCKAETLMPILEMEQMFSPGNLLPIAKVEVCDQARLLISKLPEKDKLSFLSKVQKHYVAAAKHLLEKTPIKHNCILKNFQCLQPKERTKSKSVIHIKNMVRSLPLKNISATAVSDEWRLLQLEDIKVMEAERIDHYWLRIFNIRNAFGSIKYPLLTTVVKAALSLSHGSADVERGFSRSKLVLSEDKTCMLVRTLNAKLNVLDGMKKYHNSAALVPISRELISMAQQAHQSYILYLEEEKRKALEMKQINDDKAALLLKEEESRNKFAESKTILKKMEQEAKESRKKREATQESADSLLKEASKRLKLAIEKNDLTAIRVAHGMIEGANSLRTEEREQDKELLCIETKISTRKSGLISSFFSKMPKRSSE